MASDGAGRRPDHTSGPLTQAQIWDDSAWLLQKYHSIHVRGEDMEDLLDRYEDETLGDALGMDDGVVEGGALPADEAEAGSVQQGVSVAVDTPSQPDEGEPGPGPGMGGQASKPQSPATPPPRPTRPPQPPQPPRHPSQKT
ncbi:hypothetical protein KEM52_002293 [Ascosphaera acerosa]|nr:hypothetical protein KEM52_002293 [Ascosphaera acerosa]